MARDQEIKQINAILDGNMKVDDALTDVKKWFEISVHLLANDIANLPVEKRKNAVDKMKESLPEWVDDVIPLARHLINESLQSHTKQ